MPDDRLRCSDCGAEIREVAVSIEERVDEGRTKDVSLFPWNDTSKPYRHEWDEIRLLPACDCAVFDIDTETAPEAWKEDA